MFRNCAHLRAEIKKCVRKNSRKIFSIFQQNRPEISFFLGKSTFWAQILPLILLCFGGWGQFSGTNSLNWTLLNVNFSSVSTGKLTPNPQDLGVLGTKNGIKKSIFLPKTQKRSILALRTGILTPTLKQ